jgi:hypothetical protein
MATTVRQPALTFTITDGDGVVHSVGAALNTLTTTTDGYFEEYYTTSTSYATVDFGEIATAQFVLVQNVDDTDDVIVGVGAVASEEAVAQLEPGCVFLSYLPSGVSLFRLKSSANTPRARVVAVST